MELPQLNNIKRVLIANRGEIANRCIRACRTVGVTSVAIYTRSDVASTHVASADEAIMLEGDGTAGYLNIDNILHICQQHSIDAVIPGYGFLSENVQFAQTVKDHGIIFAGPSPESISEMGLKHRAKDVAIRLNVPTVPGTGLLSSESEALAAAEKIGYPVMLKSTGGGGGMGLEICHSPESIKAAFATVRNRGEALFKNSGVLLEKYYPKSRHIEVQVFGNGKDTIHFGERECSIQRRHQKVIEECPSPFVERHPELRKQLTECATRYASDLNYKSAGTVEFLVDDETGSFFFLEMNTRLQVEHGITELCYGVDIVVLMLRQADMEKAGEHGIPSVELLSLQKDNPMGASIEARIYAEDPHHNFAPSPGIFQEVYWPAEDGVRIDTWIKSGQDVSVHYDPLLAKAMVHAPTRGQAIQKMRHLLSQGIILKGPTTNLGFLKEIVMSKPFGEGDTLTNFLDTRFNYQPCGIDVLSPGAFTTVQDFPARPSIGHGVPKSGPMDSLSSRIANLLVGNEPGKELLEVTLMGPTLKFTSGAVVSVCGANVSLSVDGTERPTWSRLVIQAGQTLKVGQVKGAGCRVYIAVRGGFPNIPLVLGSKSTTPSLKFGGCQGRTLRQGDFLNLEDDTARWSAETQEYSLPTQLVPSMDVRQIYVLQGPHDSEDIMTAADREMLYSTAWKVGHNSSRTGVRLLGPVPQWARTHGGEAGSHPSNYLDYGYPSLGGMNWGGDSPCIFSVDSPNFGGLVCSSTVISAELWKLGQLKPDDTFHLVPVSLANAVQQIHRVESFVSTISNVINGSAFNTPQAIWTISPKSITSRDAILKTVDSSQDRSRPKVTYRQGGDRFIVMEFGEQSPDILIVARIRVLIEKLKSDHSLRILLTPHVGSLTIEYDPLQISQHELLSRVHEIENNLGATVGEAVPCRELRLPLVMDHPEVQECIQRYMETVRSKAAYLPDNLEYLRKSNGLQSRREVFEMMLNTDFVVVAVGFLCGAPILFPLSPKRLTCQKYNPTRVSTPGGTFGLGGSIFSGYPIEQPGGYMMVARTLEMWDSYGTKPDFNPDKPWIFEPFDKVKFYEVSVEEYDSLAMDFKAGKYEWAISHSTFDFGKAHEEVQRGRQDPSVVKFREQQLKGLREQEKIEADLYSQWQTENSSEESTTHGDAALRDATKKRVLSPMAANLWKVEVKPGDVLQKGQVVAVLEAMKMEVNVTVPEDLVGCRVHSLLRKPASLVSLGDVLILAH